VVPAVVVAVSAVVGSFWVVVAIVVVPVVVVAVSAVVGSFWVVVAIVVAGPVGIAVLPEILVGPL